MNNQVPGTERTQKRLAVCLALTAGYLDGYGLFIFGTYVSFMSGNTTMAGLKIGQASFMAALSPAIAIVCFVAGSLAGNLITHFRLRHPHRLLFGIIAALLVTVMQLGTEDAFKDLNIAGLSFGMGMVNPALSKIGAENVSLTFMTGTLSRIGSHLALAVKRAPVPASEGPWDTHLHRARIATQLWVSFVLGACMSGIVMAVANSLSVTSSFALLPCIAMMLVLAVTDALQRTERSKACDA